jgi:hypothetical protein
MKSDSTSEPMSHGYLVKHTNSLHNWLSMHHILCMYATGLPVAVWQVILQKLTLWVQPTSNWAHNRSVLAAARDIAAVSTACTDMLAAAGDGWTALGESLKQLPAVGVDWDALLSEPLRCTAAQLKAAARACYCTVGGVSASVVI